MRLGRRFGLSAKQKLEVWRRWKAGQTLHEIGRAFGKDHNSIRGEGLGVDMYPSNSRSVGERDFKKYTDIRA